VHVVCTVTKVDRLDAMVSSGKQSSSVRGARGPMTAHVLRRRSTRTLLLEPASTVTTSHTRTPPASVAMRRARQSSGWCSNVEATPSRRPSAASRRTPATATFAGGEKRTKRLEAA